MECFKLLNGSPGLPSKVWLPYIYVIQDRDTVLYVGQTVHVSQRLGQHRRQFWEEGLNVAPMTVVVMEPRLALYAVGWTHAHADHRGHSFKIADYAEAAITRTHRAQRNLKNNEPPFKAPGLRFDVEALWPAMEAGLSIDLDAPHTEKWASIRRLGFLVDDIAAKHNLITHSILEAA